MYVDNELVLEEGMACETTAGTDYASGCIDLGVAGRDVGAGRPIQVAINVTTDFASTDSATIQFQLLEDSDTGIDGNSIILSSTELFAFATMTAGRDPIVIPIPTGVALRYIGLGVVTGSFTTTAGTIDAVVVLEAQTNV